MINNCKQQEKSSKQQAVSSKLSECKTPKLTAHRSLLTADETLHSYSYNKAAKI